MNRKIKLSIIFLLLMSLLILPLIPARVSAKPMYNVGDPWIVEDEWAFVFTGVYETDERIPSAMTNPKHVFVLEYAYANLGYNGGEYAGLYIDSSNMTLKTEKMGDAWYPISVNIPQSVPVGAICCAEIGYGITYCDPFKVTVTITDSNGTPQSATFSIEAKDYESYFDVDSLIPDISEDYLEIGDVWKVEDEWEFTIDGFTEVKERDRDSKKNPAAAYTIDYSFTSLQDDPNPSYPLMFNLENGVVDCMGKIGYKYLSKTTYDQRPEKGQLVHRQAHIGLDTAGEFKISCTVYDSHGEKHSQTFVIDPYKKPDKDKESDQPKKIVEEQTKETVQSEETIEEQTVGCQQ